ncbi:MAG: hypothetical protein MRY74_09200 [Neomegalonema sp.]|nr:hypothetical protein [Neomegalonema sp.]
MKRTLSVLALLGAVAVSGPANAAECFPIGGVAVPNFFSEGEGQPIVISATLTGTVHNAAGKILAQRKTETGLEMDIEHYFGRSDGGAFLTKDKAVLTAIPGKPGRYMIEITYDIQKDTTRGTLKGVHGQFSSYGLVDLRDESNLVGMVRYTGKICK